MIQNLFEKFVQEYEGPKLAFIVTGGGIGIHELAQTMGASRVLHAIFVPYSYEVSEKFIDKGVYPGLGAEYTRKAVSQRSARLLCGAGMEHWPDCKVIACTAATTTNRYRRGSNEAFIAVGNPNPKVSSAEQIEDYHLPLSKLSEEDYNKMGLGHAAWKRRSEDREITKFLLELAMR